jgi:hypothetical protein
VVIPIAVFIRIDGGTASASPFQRMTKIVHDHAGIRVHVSLVHDALETAFTLGRNNPVTTGFGAGGRGGGFWSGSSTVLAAFSAQFPVATLGDFASRAIRRIVLRSTPVNGSA